MNLDKAISQLESLLKTRKILIKHTGDKEYIKDVKAIESLLRHIKKRRRRLYMSTKSWFKKLWIEIQLLLFSIFKKKG